MSTTRTEGSVSVRRRCGAEASCRNQRGGCAAVFLPPLPSARGRMSAFSLDPWRLLGTKLHRENVNASPRCCSAKPPSPPSRSTTRCPPHPPLSGWTDRRPSQSPLHTAGEATRCYGGFGTPAQNRMHPCGSAHRQSGTHHTTEPQLHLV